MTRTANHLSAHLAVHPDVAQALAEHLPVVALESTIISHGLPYPQNVELAREVEQIIRDNGATPATIAVIDGVCCIGLHPAQLEQLATEAGVVKATTRAPDATAAWIPGIESSKITQFSGRTPMNSAALR